MYRVEITAGAEHDLEQLDKPAVVRLYNRLKWPGENFERITLESLSGPLASLCKFRVGDYRVLYDALREERLLVIHRIRHRCDVYKAK
jgi:mRNA-degrading endonuclease RelE of RelBE toxin-antitoxin system